MLFLVVPILYIVSPKYILILCDQASECALYLTSATSTASGPQFEGVASPLPHLDCAVEILGGVTRSIAAVASIPVEAVDLPIKSKKNMIDIHSIKDIIIQKSIRG